METCSVVLTFESIMETCSVVLTFKSIMKTCSVVQTFESVDEILWCDHSNETFLAVLSHGTICFSMLYLGFIWNFI